MSEPKSDFGELADRCTARFKRDRELRLELANELETHLVAAAAEYESADYAPDDARAAAVRDFGNVEEVAEGLWAANRRRLSWRFWGWWVARVTLLPACLLATLAFVFHGILAGGMMSGGLFGPVGEWQAARLQAQLTPTQRLIYAGDETQSDAVARWRALRDAYPREPLFQLKVIGELLSRREVVDQPGRDLPLLDLSAFEGELERGRGLDPDNGVYDLLHAAVLLRRAGEIELNDQSHGGEGAESFLSTPGSVFESIPPERENVTPPRWTHPPDQARVEQSLWYYRRAAAKPYIAMHQLDFQRLRMAQLPPPRSMMAYLGRAGDGLILALPQLGLDRFLTRAVVTHAVGLAEANRGAEAIAWLDVADEANRKVAASRELLIGVMVSVGDLEMLKRARAWVARRSGDDAGAERAVARADTFRKQSASFWSGATDDAYDDRRARAGLMVGALVPSVPGYTVDAAPFRLGEYLLVDRFGLTGLLVALTALAVLGSLGGLWASRREGPPTLLWIGWRRLSGVLAVGVLAPTVVFAAWAYSPWGGRDFGIDQRPWLLMSYGVVLAVVVVSGLSLGGRAVARRADTLGLPVPTPGVRWVGGLVGGVALAGATGFLCWAIVNDLEHLGDAESKALWWYAAVVIEVGVIWLIVARWIIHVRSVTRPWFALRRAALLAAGLATVLTAAVWVPTLTGSTGTDGMFFRRFAVAALLPLSGLVGLIWLSHRPGPSVDFARALVRSLGPVFAAAGLLLVIVWGPLLAWREATLASRMMAQSAVFVDLEVERSDGKKMRRWAAGAELSAPEMEIRTQP